MMACLDIIHRVSKVVVHYRASPPNKVSDYFWTSLFDKLQEFMPVATGPQAVAKAVRSDRIQAFATLPN